MKKNAFVVVANPGRASLCSALAKTCASVLVKEGYRTFFHDLYAEKFPPILPAGEEGGSAKLPALVGRHCREIRSADIIVVVHPNWWGQPPAIMKGWIDRVFRPGVAYRFREGDGGEGVPEGLLKARAAVVLNTSNTAAGREADEFGDPLDAIWRNCVFGLCGVKKVVRKTYGVVVTSTLHRRRGWLKDAESTVRKAVRG